MSALRSAVAHGRLGAVALLVLASLGSCPPAHDQITALVFRVDPGLVRLMPDGEVVIVKTATGRRNTYTCRGARAAGTVTCPTLSSGLQTSDLQGIVTISVLDAAAPPRGPGDV